MEISGSDDGNLAFLPEHRRREAERGHDPDAPRWTDWLELLAAMPQVSGLVDQGATGDEIDDAAAAEPLLTLPEMQRICARASAKLRHPCPEWRRLAMIERVMTIVAAELESAVELALARCGETRETRMAEAAVRVLMARLHHVRLIHYVAPRTVVRHELRRALCSATDALALMRRI